MRLKVISFLFLFLTITNIENSFSEDFKFFQPVVPPRKTQVIAHRGLRICAPENTIPAFALCIKNYFEWVEVDVRMTKDKHHVIIHDETLNRTTNGKGLVSDHTLAEIKALDAGSWFSTRYENTRIPTLSETLNFCKGRINLYLDCKEVDPILLVKEIKEAKMENQVIVYGSSHILRIIEKESNRTIATMSNYGTNPDVYAWIGKDRPIALEIKYESVSAEIVSKLKNAGVMVQVQCLGENDNSTVWDKLIDMGVDLIQTDHAEEVVAKYTWKAIGNNRPVLVAAHRGAKAFAPENTMSSYKKAIELRLDFIEIDIHQTKDGKLVLMHDSSLKRTTGLDKNIKDVLFEEIKSISAGEWFSKSYANEKIPSIDEVFEMAKGKIKFYIDFKDGESEKLIDAIHRNRIIEDCVVYGNPTKLAELKALEPKLKVMPGLSKQSQIDMLIEMCHPYAFDVKWDILSRELISECHSKGVKVFSDAMGGNENVDSFYHAIDLGIDCIQTDEPIILMRAVEIFYSKNQKRMKG